MKTFLVGIYLVMAIGSAYATPPLEERNIHGMYSRAQVNDLSNFRSRVTGMVVDINTEDSCTGTLIGPAQILTAAHCVYNFETKTWSDGFTFTAGKISKNDNGLATASFKKFFIQQEYIDTMSEEFDFAIVELDSPIGNTAGWAGFRSLEGTEAQNGAGLNITFSGYPGDKDYGSLWSVSCPAVVNGPLLNYFCDSYAGMSGSAFFQTNDTQNFVIGIHTWGGPTNNGGVYINSKNFDLINAWKNSTSYSSNTVIYFKK